MAKLIGVVKGEKISSYVTFIIRDDRTVGVGSSSKILFQTSDTTWQAYNGGLNKLPHKGAPPTLSRYGDSLYSNWYISPRVSYNRPFTTRSDWQYSWLFNAEYPMIRWLEKHGYHVSYTTGVDTDRDGASILNHKVFISVGHDEYWSAGQRKNVESARDKGIHLAFFSGNEVFWKTRWDAEHRTLVTYKETNSDLSMPRKVDPDPAWTGTWRDPSYAPADGGKPENALTGTVFSVNSTEAGNVSPLEPFAGLTILPSDGKMRLWRGISDVANQIAGEPGVTLSGGCNCILGNEWDEDLDNGFRPAGLIRLSTTHHPIPTRYLLDYGSPFGYGAGEATHHLTLYRHPTSRALVFGAGTVNWAWGLDSHHDNDPIFGLSTPTAVPQLQQATLNLLVDMGVQPSTIQSDPPLVAQTASTDTTPPTSNFPHPGQPKVVGRAEVGRAATISGYAYDDANLFGVVGGVEVSPDGGATWHPAEGREKWTYTWTPTATGTAYVKTRATDDSGNTEPDDGNSVDVPVSPRSNHAVILYGVDGSYATSTIDSAGNLTKRVEGTGFWPWTHIAAGAGSQLLWYNSNSGIGVTGILSEAGEYTDYTGRQPYTWCKGWDQVTITSNNIVLFYKRNRNTAECGGFNYAIGRITAGGIFTNLSIGDIPLEWTHVAASANNVLLFYNSENGFAQTYKLDQNGGLRSLAVFTFDLNWTHIVPAANNLFLFYNKNPDPLTGRSKRAFGRVDDNGVYTDLTYLNQPGTFTSGWSNIIGGAMNDVILFYNGTNGLTWTGRLNADGVYGDLLPYTGGFGTAALSLGIAE